MTYILKTAPLNISKLSLVLCLTMLAACSSNSSLVSSFSQRKYTKGYFADAAGQKPTVTGIKASKAEEKKTLVSEVQNSNTVQSIAMPNLQQIPSREGLRGGFSIPAKEVNEAIVAVEQTKVISTEPSTTRVNVDDADLKTNGIILFVLAAILLVLGFLFLSTLGFLGLIMIVGGILLAIVGFTQFFGHIPKHVDKPVELDNGHSTNDPIQQYSNRKDSNGSTGGITGLLMIIGGILVGLVAIIVAFGLGGLGALSVLAILIGVVALSLIVEGISICINAVAGNNK